MSGSPEPGPPGGADARALFNPAFLAALIARAAAGHERDHTVALPLAYGFLVAPMILHPPTRQALPRVNAGLAKWADEHPLLRAEWRQRAPRMSEVTRRALRFGLRHRLLVLTPDGIGAGAGLEALPTPDEPDALACWRAAESLGR